MNTVKLPISIKGATFTNRSLVTGNTTHTYSETVRGRSTEDRNIVGSRRRDETHRVETHISQQNSYQPTARYNEREEINKKVNNIVIHGIEERNLESDIICIYYLEDF